MPHVPQWHDVTTPLIASCRCTQDFTEFAEEFSKGDRDAGLVWEQKYPERGRPYVGNEVRCFIGIFCGRRKIRDQPINSYTKFGQLIIGIIINIMDTRCHIYTVVIFGRNCWLELVCLTFTHKDSATIS